MDWLTSAAGGSAPSPAGLDARLEGGPDLELRDMGRVVAEMRALSSGRGFELQAPLKDGQGQDNTNVGRLLGPIYPSRSY